MLVTGGQGQVATALHGLRDRAAEAGIAVIRVGRPEVDFDQPATLDRAFDRHRPDCLVNAAAWTAVDAAEGEPEAAYRANQAAPRRLAQLCAEAGVPMIHLSTDYVYRGTKATPYVETDPADPDSVYGRSKLAGERAVLASARRAVVLRTAWVYGATGRNFLTTMLAASRKAGTLRVVADQIGCPTAAPDLAEAILQIAPQVATRWNTAQRGVFHAAGAGETSWHGFATAIFAAAARHGLAAPHVEAIRTADWPTPATRPANSRLDCSKLRERFGVHLPPWPDGLERVIDAAFAGRAA